MKKIYLFLAVMAVHLTVCHSVDWIDTIKYNTETWVSDLAVNPKQEIIMLGFSSRGYSAPDLSKFRTFVECRTSDRNLKWINNQVSGAEAASNLAQDATGNSYVA